MAVDKKIKYEIKFDEKKSVCTKKVELKRYRNFKALICCLCKEETKYREWCVKIREKAFTKLDSCFERSIQKKRLQFFDIFICICLSKYIYKA